MIKLWNPEGADDQPVPAVSDAEFMAELERLHGERPEAVDTDPEPGGGSVLDCLARLVAAFDADDGQCDDVYLATVGLLYHHLGGRPWSRSAGTSTGATTATSSPMGRYRSSSATSVGSPAGRGRLRAGRSMQTTPPAGFPPRVTTTRCGAASPKAHRPRRVIGRGRPAAGEQQG